MLSSYAQTYPPEHFAVLEHSGRLVKWCIELNGYNITYEPRKAIKGQFLADLITEFSVTNLLPSPDRQPSIQLPLAPSRVGMYVDEASKASAPARGVNLRALLGIEFELKVQFQFPFTNNVPEYEALATGLKRA